jgi:DNA-directed RNA polymerase specialized sigma24 family protein
MLSIRAIRAMTLNARDGLTEDAIAAELGVSRTAVHRDLRRARQAMSAQTTAQAYVRYCASTRRRPRRKDARPEPMGLV